MLASELLEHEVLDTEGRRAGYVLDIRARPARGGTALMVEGLVVGRRRHIRLLGYERSDEVGPALFAMLVNRLHRNTRLAPLSDVDIESDGTVRLKVPWSELRELPEN